MVGVENVTLVYAKLENRPGALERAARAIADRRVNVEAVSVETVGQTGFVRFLSPRARETVEALRGLGLEAYESPSLAAQLPNRSGELARACADLASAGINVEAIITTPDGRLAFRTSDNDRALAILKKL